MGMLTDAMADRLDSTRDRALFEGDAVEDLRRDYLAGEADECGAISGVLDFEVWMEQTLD